jgi:AcrR family transcriptional regulator
MNQLHDVLADLPVELHPPEPGSPPARILAATRELLATRGPAGVSMRAVAARADVNQAMIHYYFRSKDNLLDVLIGQEILQLLRDVIGGLGDLPASAELFVQHPLRILDALRADPVRMQLLRLVLAAEPDRLRRVVRNLGQHGVLGAANALLALATGARDAGQLPDVDPASILLFLLANAYGLILMAPVAREVTGFTLEDDEHWRQHRQNLEVLLRHGLLTDGRTPR